MLARRAAALANQAVGTRIFPHRKARAGTPPGVHDVLAAARSVGHPLQELDHDQAGLGFHAASVRPARRRRLEARVQSRPKSSRQDAFAGLDVAYDDHRVTHTHVCADPPGIDDHVAQRRGARGQPRRSKSDTGLGAVGESALCSSS
jgi:hypothetical protein